jgi:hypothetical protein
MVRLTSTTRKARSPSTPIGSRSSSFGHAHYQAIAEFAIPELAKSTVLNDLPMAGDPLQPFARVRDRASGGNPQGNNRIGGMLYLRGPRAPELRVNTYDYYDAPGDNTQRLLAMRNAGNLAVAPVDGYFEVEGGPGHTAGWMSPIPPSWEPLLGGGFLMGNSSGGGYKIVQDNGKSERTEASGTLSLRM